MFPPRIANQADDALCVCGHARAVHGHHRAGTDCGIDGPKRCASFRHATPLVARVLERVRRPAGREPVAPLAPVYLFNAVERRSPQRTSA